MTKSLFFVVSGEGKKDVDVLPSLTEKGFTQINRAAIQIARALRARGQKNVQIRSSARMWALGSSYLIAERVKQPHVTVETAIGDMDGAREGRSAVSRRFFEYLGKLFTQFVEGVLPDAIIHITHFEVLRELADMFGHSEPIKDGEIIILDLHRNGSEQVLIMAVFRGDNSKRIVCSLPTNLFRAQFH